MTRDEPVLEESPVGLILNLSFDMNEGRIEYLVTARSVIRSGTEAGMTLSKSVEAVFHGSGLPGDIIEAVYAGPDGTEETIRLFFGPVE